MGLSRWHPVSAPLPLGCVVKNFSLASAVNCLASAGHCSRRALLTQAVLGAGAACTLGTVAAAGETPKPSQGGIGICLNTATIRGQKLSVPEQVEVTAKAGYQAIEPWLNDLHKFADGGGSLADLRKKIADLGLVVPSAIGFANWIDDDDAKRKAGLEQWKRDAEVVAAIGGTRMAAPPAGAYRVSLELPKVAARYRTLLDLSGELGMVPELEMWGSSKTLNRMSEIAYVLVECGHAQACGLLDMYHIYKGGSDFTGLRLFRGDALHVFHANDYPADPPRDKVTDAERIYPGDGVAPWPAVLADLKAIGFRGYLSLEIFNRTYWQQDALTCARNGREKIQKLLEKAAD